eukprot:543403-Prymnesium_polylepis.1
MGHNAHLQPATCWPHVRCSAAATPAGRTTGCTTLGAAASLLVARRGVRRAACGAALHTTCTHGHTRTRTHVVYEMLPGGAHLAGSAGARRSGRLPR